MHAKLLFPITAIQSLQIVLVYSVRYWSDIKDIKSILKLSYHMATYFYERHKRGAHLEKRSLMFQFDQQSLPTLFHCGSYHLFGLRS